MVWPLACRWAISRAVKNACKVGARVLTGVLPGAHPGAGRPAPSARERPTGTRTCAWGRCGPERWTAAPDAYQPSTVATANECLMSWTRGRQDADRGVSLACPARRVNVRPTLL